VTSALLDVRGLRVSYGGINAVKGINLQVNAGEIVCLIGANGAGKTSTLKAIAGLLEIEREAVFFRGEASGGLPPFRLVRRGLALVPEGRGIFPQLTVAENLTMGAYTRTDREAIAIDLREVLASFPILHDRRSQVAGTLSGGEQQMLAIGRALMSRPRLLLLDEPSMGLAPLIVSRIFEILRRIAQTGVAILVVEQNARLALQTAESAYVMENGRIVLTGPAQSLLHNDQVRKAYLGE
jgi:branched-chain amino acid transport system ATP-binding protein